MYVSVRVPALAARFAMCWHIISVMTDYEGPVTAAALRTLQKVKCDISVSDCECHSNLNLSAPVSTVDSDTANISVTLTG